jgi:S-adenosyl-L-methionine hydrolase (adenosine-forming)
MAKRALVTLTTDFGSADPYVGAMKGMILRHCPQADIVDITHDVPPHEVLSGAFTLAHSAPYFPDGTMHVVVVDPGVGTDRNILMGQFGGHYFLFPDNGVISFIKQIMPLQALVMVRNEAVLPPSSGISTTFHGRDIFGPLAGKILSGVDINDLGPTPSTFKLLDLPDCQDEDDSILGWVIHVDHFGNLVSNITQDRVFRYWKETGSLSVDCRGKTVGPLLSTYADVERNQPLALFNSMGYLEIAVNQGRACDVFQASLGAKIRIREQTFLDSPRKDQASPEPPTPESQTGDTFIA